MSLITFSTVLFSEHYIVKWDKLGMPKDLEKLHNLSCLFTVNSFLEPLEAPKITLSSSQSISLIKGGQQSYDSTEKKTPLLPAKDKQ